MQCYVRNPFYLKACVEGAVRVDLDGREAGAVSPEHAAGSAAALAAYYARRKPKTKPEAQPEIAAPASAPPTGPKRLGLGDLKAAALARKRAS